MHAASSDKTRLLPPVFLSVSADVFATFVPATEPICTAEAPPSAIEMFENTAEALYVSIPR